LAFAEIVTSAIGIMLLIVTAYVLVGGTLTTTQVVMNAQSDMTALHVKMMNTAIGIDSANLSGTGLLYANVRNTGNEPITDLSHLDLLLISPGLPPVLYQKDTGWTKNFIAPDTIHPNQWDPGEVLNMSVAYTGPDPVWIQVTTSNGAYTSSYITP
jgi:archaeal flagellar protein FlaF